MKISELSRRSGVSIPTIKYYLRDGLLPQGQATAANQAEYGEEHLRRLRLIRTLVGVRRLSVSAVKEILGAITEEGDLHQIFGIVTDARPATKLKKQAKEEETAEGDTPGVADARRLITEMGWEVSPGTAAIQTLGDVLDALADVDAGIGWQSLLPYARLTDRMSELDVKQMNGASGLLELAERAVLVSVLLEPALLALRRLAQEDKSARLFSGTPE
ncbi:MULTISPECIES: MerR family transcriptional regulator [Streptomyces]|jgi:DNA-binding transcriptional MerR regulator|uniref:DNA-binding transcriptional MerR regulator n=2 Tax=Streptomyces TaxID=1883 RepID=A0A514JMC9_9ACTN|nr:MULTISPECIES: MerR family transcriptional regulator [Streptomyces]MBA8948229.1 DNA-binding transcriptional MerR regulator [Streptomyces calvus]MBA8975371.1 DNA-binding transcriptional MerR regulator [Streptomyces calvus]MYS27187.1 MerR family transcriptional regulator [Streptomyces sp. SID7804]QDI68490.1 transcriptional regulator [Streptomyces calvus]GGP85064.1 transcriptional regulator [Streptomyces calvus]